MSRQYYAPTQRRTVSPNLLLALIMLILLVALAVLVYDRYFTQPTLREPSGREQTRATVEPAATVTPRGPSGRDARQNATPVADKYCPGGMGWEWIEQVDDGTGRMNPVIKGACEK